MGTTSSRRAALGPVLGLALALVAGAALQGRAAGIGATVIDREGVRHEVTNLQYQGRTQLEYYVSGDRRVVPLQRIEKLRLGDDSGSESQMITVTLRDGTAETGSIVSGASLVPHEDVVGGTSVLSRFTGSTALGPFFMPIASVQEVILHHADTAGAVEDTVPRATVVLVNGESFEVRDLRFRGGRRLNYSIGARERFQDLAKVSRIEFEDETAHEEMRPVTIALWSGKTIQGTMEAGRVRLPGETDRAFFDRVYAAFTGKAGGGPFNIGVHDVKLIRFHAAAGKAAAPAPPAPGTAGAEPAAQGQP
ncbi:MAG: hypothetical protein AB1505_16830 [Candidatus Latescibacterota bacterium]